jgi:hypothetical protein
MQFSRPGTHLGHKQCTNKEGMISQLNDPDFSFLVGCDNLQIF